MSENQSGDTRGGNAKHSATWRARQNKIMDNLAALAAENSICSLTEFTELKRLHKPFKLLCVLFPDLWEHTCTTHPTQRVEHDKKRPRAARRKDSSVKNNRLYRLRKQAFLESVCARLLDLGVVEDLFRLCLPVKRDR